MQKFKGKIKTIDVTAKEWFDKVNGNSYFAARVILNYQMRNETTIVLPFQYGYGDSYRHQSFGKLIDLKIIKADKMDTDWNYCQNNNITLRYQKHKNCLKRDVISFGTE